MPAELRKTLLHVEKTLVEGGRHAPQPLLMVAAAAVVTSPWAGKGFVEDLRQAFRMLRRVSANC